MTGHRAGEGSREPEVPLQSSGSKINERGVSQSSPQVQLFNESCSEGKDVIASWAEFVIIPSHCFYSSGTGGKILNLTL